MQFLKAQLLTMRLSDRQWQQICRRLNEIEDTIAAGIGSDRDDLIAQAQLLLFYQRDFEWSEWSEQLVENLDRRHPRVRWRRENMSALIRFRLARALLAMSGVCVRLARPLVPVPLDIDPLARDECRRAEAPSVGQLAGLFFAPMMRN